MQSFSENEFYQFTWPKMIKGYYLKKRSLQNDEQQLFCKDHYLVMDTVLINLKM